LVNWYGILPSFLVSISPFARYTPSPLAPFVFSYFTFSCLLHTAFCLLCALRSLCEINRSFKSCCIYYPKQPSKLPADRDLELKWVAEIIGKGKYYLPGPFPGPLPCTLPELQIFCFLTFRGWGAKVSIMKILSETRGIYGTDF
jgi:hypothetical protein